MMKILVPLRVAILMGGRNKSYYLRVRVLILSLRVLFLPFILVPINSLNCFLVDGVACLIVELRL